MKSALSVAMEFLKIGAQTKLPAEILTLVTKYRHIFATTKDLPEYHGAELSDIIKKNTGLNIQVLIEKSLNTPVVLTVAFQGHTGNGARWGTKTAASKLANRQGFVQDVLTGTVDLENVRVSGVFSEIPALLAIPVNLFSTDLLTDEEITAAILHEIGHAFFLLATLGEYVWLNYYLQDGVDIVLGKKPNIYKVEILSQVYLAKTLPDKAQVEALKQPTETNVRQALLTNLGTKARDYFGQRIGLGAYKRDEQLADLFVSRLGFGRALVTGDQKLNKMYSLFNRTAHGRFYNLTIEAIKVGTWVVAGMAAPVVVGIATILALGYLSPRGVPFDNATERALKVKRDLIAQLKDVETAPILKESLLDDLAAVDEITKNMTQYRTTFEVVAQFLIPTRRSDAQRLRLEQQLEELLNNDLFAVAAKLNQHA